MMTEHSARALKFHEKFLLVAAGLAALATPVFGQAAAPAKQDATVKAPAYEVVSVKPSKPCLGMSMSSSPGRLSDRCVTLWGLMFNAYGLRPNDSRTPGLPGWAHAAQFDIEAKMDDDTAATLQKLPREEQQKQRDLMLQSILADRFKLKIHHEIKEGPIYALVIAKGGFQTERMAYGPDPAWIRLGLRTD